MHRLLLVGLLVVGFASVASAAEKPARQQATGGIVTADTTVLATGGDVTALTIACGASACEVGLHDVATAGGVTNANGVFEGRAAANSSAVFQFDPPIKFDTGVTVNLDANASAVTVLTQVP